MESIAILIYIASIVFSIILIVKYWHLCSNVELILEKINGDKTSKMDKLLYLSATKSPTFDKELQDSIYIDFMEIARTVDYPENKSKKYANKYSIWAKRCEYYGWTFPEVFIELNSYEQFAKKFYFMANEEIM